MNLRGEWATEVHRAGPRNFWISYEGTPYKYNGIAVANAAKPAKGTGSIKGVSQFSSPAPSAYTCQWKLKRTNATNPQVTTACP